MAKTPSKKTITTHVHDATRKNIPTAEFEAMVRPEDRTSRTLRYPRNPDLDPQLVWRGKDTQDWSDLVVHAPPLYIQEKVHPKVLVDDLLRRTQEARSEESGFQTDLFGAFNGVPKGADKTEFYQHDQNWTNRMILGDSLQVMASLAEREGLRGKVQCIYLDPPYGIKFNSNFQWSTTSHDVKDGNIDHVTREPEQVKAFRDTWRDGINSYLTYLRDRLTVARDLLADSGSIFVQISDENLHRVRAVMDEVFGERNFCSLISFSKTSGATSTLLPSVADYLVWYAKDRDCTKYRPLYTKQEPIENPNERYICVETPDGKIIDLSLGQKTGKAPIPDGRILRLRATDSQGGSSDPNSVVNWNGGKYRVPPGRHWSVTVRGTQKAADIGRCFAVGKTLRWKSYHDEFPYRPTHNNWTDISPTGFGEDKIYIVQTIAGIVRRCLLMTTDPGDLVLDPTCGSGTTATVAEQWGRRWITIDTSRVALALARARIMGARYPFYLLADSRDGQQKEAEVSRTAPSLRPVQGNIRHGFVYKRVPHVTLGSIADNAEIDVIWEKWQRELEPLRSKLNKSLEKFWEEWEIPRDADPKWSAGNQELHTAWWKARTARRMDIEASITTRGKLELLYDDPYEDEKAVRVAGPFTVESLSPHRTLGVDENDELIDGLRERRVSYGEKQSFAQMILENLRVAGLQQAEKAGRIAFTSLTSWPGTFVCGEGRYAEGDAERRAAIFIGPEFGTVQRPDLVAAAREAAEAGFDVLVACAFNYEAHTTEFNKLGKLPVLKARMNAELHMSDDLKNTGKGNLFVIFGEPEVEIVPSAGGKIQVRVKGVDVFKPQTGKVQSDSTDGIACWFLDTDYNEESFFVRHAYFLGATDPYNALKTTLKAEIDPEAWATLRSDVSRPFEKPKGGRIAVKVINHLGDEVMKVFKV